MPTRPDPSELRGAMPAPEGNYMGGRVKHRRRIVQQDKPTGRQPSCAQGKSRRLRPDPRIIVPKALSSSVAKMLVPGATGLAPCISQGSVGGFCGPQSGDLSRGSADRFSAARCRRSCRCRPSIPAGQHEARIRARDAACIRRAVLLDQVSGGSVIDFSDAAARRGDRDALTGDAPRC